MGVVEPVGDAVTGVAVGDHVVINPGLSDRTCEYCLAGEQPLCPRFGILGEHLPGTIAEYVVVPAANVRRVSPADAIRPRRRRSRSRRSRRGACSSRARTLAAGEHVLIWGIGGGVALAACRSRS